jgi:flagellar basal body-associated protein FliL
MAEEEIAEEEEEEEKPKRGIPKIAIVIGISLVCLILAGVIGLFVKKKLTERPKPHLIIDREEAVELRKLVEMPIPKIHNLGSFFARVQSLEEPIYVKIENLSLAFYDEDGGEGHGYGEEDKGVEGELIEKEFRIRDIVNTLLISSTPEIGTLEGKREFKEKLLHEVNHILHTGRIEAVYCEVILQ